MKIKKIIAMFTSVMLVFALAFSAHAGIWRYEKRGWWYENDDHSYPINDWVFDHDKWYHVDGNGYLQTGWLLDNGVWYYLDLTGAMVRNTTLVIDNVSYTFLSSGALYEGSSQDAAKMPQSGSLNGRTFQNIWSDYKMTLTADCQTSALSNNSPDLEIQDINVSLPKGEGYLKITYYNQNQVVTDEIMQQFIEAEFPHLITEGRYYDAYFGSYKFKSYENLMNSYTRSFYFRAVENYVMVIRVLYHNDLKPDIDQMLNSMSKIR